MNDTAIIVEVMIEVVVQLMVLYLTVITYRLHPGGIIGVYILLSTIFSVIRRSMSISGEVLDASLDAASTAKLLVYGILVLVSLVGSFVIAMKRFTILESAGIFIIGMVPAMIIDLIITTVWQP